MFEGIRILKGELTDALKAKGLGFRQDYVDIYSSSWGPDDNGYEVAEVGAMTEEVISQGASEVFMIVFVGVHVLRLWFSLASQKIGGLMVLDVVVFLGKAVSTHPPISRLCSNNY